MIYIIDMGSSVFVAFLPILLFLLVNVVNIFLSIWAYRDSRKRGNSKEFSLIILVAVLFFPIIGLIVYLVIRKD